MMPLVIGDYWNLFAIILDVSLRRKKTAVVAAALDFLIEMCAIVGIYTTTRKVIR